MDRAFAKRTLSLLLISLEIIGTTCTSLPPIFANNNYQPSEIVECDVCIIGGGATGTYAAVRLQEMGHRICIVEERGYLGGHTQTYVDPLNGAVEELGVVVYQPRNITRDFFGRFGLRLTALSFDNKGPTPQFDFRTGKRLPDREEPGSRDQTDALGRYAAQLAKYPYLATGFDLEYPVPSDLLMPFGSFADKYNLSAAVPTIFKYAQGLGDFLDQSTLYVMKNFGLDDYEDISKSGWLTAADNDNSKLYQKALERLGGERVFLKGSIVATARDVTTSDRPMPHQPRILISTPTGLKLIKAKKILLTIPPLLSNLHNWDLDSEEHSLFSEFRSSAFYTGLLNNTGLPATSDVIQNAASNTSFNLPVFPGIYSLTPAPQIGPESFSVKYGSPVPIPEEVVKQEIIAAVQRLQKNVTQPEFLAFESHTPFELTVSVQKIANGYYERLYGLQGRNGMFYTGAAFHTHDSALLWQFTEDKVLPKLNASLF